ncbi:MAG TPA: hypothetical protein VHV51_02480, partial [Polyangiaceae bacterium]|jgi:hypothetical protein|nr:hypothetical protein [Polyangiaceae bacterium]
LPRQQLPNPVRALSAIVLGLALLSRAALAVPLSEEDPRGLAQLAAAHPAALGPLRDGDAALNAGQFATALALFDDASANAPVTAIVERKRCQALLGLGRRADALTACEAAINAGGQAALDLRAKVGALMTGPDAPTPTEASEAYWLARLASSSLPGEPWGYAAFAQIGRRIGDPVLWARSVEQLRRVAPNHFETKAAVLLVDRADKWRPKAFAWLFLLCAGLASALHAARRKQAELLTAPAASRVPER